MTFRTLYVCILATAGLLAGCRESSDPKVGVSLARTTDSNLAVSNLDSQIALYENSIEGGTYDAGDLLDLVILYADGARFLGRVDYFDQMLDLAHRAETEFPSESDAWEASARVAVTRHEFTGAASKLDRMLAEGGDEATYQAILLVVQQGQSQGLTTLLAKRQNQVEVNPSYETWLMLAGVQMELGKYELADRSIENALAAYRDISPFAFAWANFQRGLLWGEIAAEPDLLRAQKYYEMAVDYLPQYAQARVHLAEVYRKLGFVDMALATLGPTLAAADPEGRGLTAEILRRRKLEETGKRYATEAEDIYGRLLDQHALAFADHAAEFFLGPARDPSRALTLAQQNFRNRQTRGSYELLFDALLANDRTDEACEHWHEVAVLLATRPDLRALKPGYQHLCD